MVGKSKINTRIAGNFKNFKLASSVKILIIVNCININDMLLKFSQIGSYDRTDREHILFNFNILNVWSASRKFFFISHCLYICHNIFFIPHFQFFDVCIIYQTGNLFNIVYIILRLMILEVSARILLENVYFFSFVWHLHKLVLTSNNLSK